MAQPGSSPGTVPVHSTCVSTLGASKDICKQSRCPWPSQLSPWHFGGMTIHCKIPSDDFVCPVSYTGARNEVWPQELAALLPACSHQLSEAGMGSGQLRERG